MVNSWDLWDTLISRRTIKPADVFELIEHITSTPGYYNARMEAERLSRKNISETTLERIYDFLDYPEEKKKELKSLELKLEYDTSYPITGNVDKKKYHDIIVTDMYLPKEHILAILKKCKIPTPDRNIYLSCETGLTKSSGTIYKQLSKDFPTLTHTGDNFACDIKKARLYNIKGIHFKESISTTATEKHWYSLGFHEKFIAGVLRASRLSLPTNFHQERWTLYSQIVSPVLIAFCEFIIDSALKKGISKLYFLARDGQILKLISEKMIAARNLDIECIYLYASRQALHLPGFTSVERSLSWILDGPHPLTLNKLSKRTEIPEYILYEVFSKYCRLPLSSNTPLNTKHIHKAINDPIITNKIFEISKENYARCIEYFEKIGLANDWKSAQKIAYVDVGWRCRLQSSLDSICNKYGCNPENTIGFYFGINDSVYADGSRCIGFLFDEKNKSQNLISDFRHHDMLEHFLRANHPQVMKYAKSNEGVLFSENLQSKCKEGIRQAHEAILCTTDHYIEQKKILPSLSILENKAFIGQFSNFLTTPSTKEARLFSGELHSSEQSGNFDEGIIAKIHLFDAFKINIPSFWPEGSFAARRLLWLLKLRRYTLLVTKKLLRKLKWEQRSQPQTPAK